MAMQLAYSIDNMPMQVDAYESVLRHQRAMEEQGWRSRHRNMEVKVHDRPEHQSYVLQIGPRLLVVPYRLLEYGGTTVVREDMDPYTMPSRYVAEPVEKRKQEKPKEKTDLCSTHIYTRK
jgi:hypothetical protein